MKHQIIYHLPIPFTYQLTKIIFVFLRLSIVKIFPKDATQRKNETLDETSGFQILFQGNDDLSIHSTILVRYIQMQEGKEVNIFLRSAKR